MTIDIIAYQEKFHDQLVDIWYRAVRQTHAFLTEEDLEFYHGIVGGGALREVEIWVALRDHQVPAGFIGLDGTKIEMLFVDPEYHGQGIGSRLIRHAESIKGGTLQVDVNEQNDGACAFYKRYGFVQSGRSELDGAGRPFPLLHMDLRRI
ncbi:GNAT family N-acetyltransferase [Paenibacillus caseinilyticus]|uniref:Acetyltransferase GCN5 n=1 Tax=Paenibacillus mucilaginosus K02 TaxID=997761 RepID=I0BH43_9BACL|nr:GNAT family N-acetyltransferase [Paenibacillus mucilaginosus]AFH61690.1 acetyltransferase GCN5 [Paenibacillus mucilaginosus K02]